MDLFRANSTLAQYTLFFITLIPTFLLADSNLSLLNNNSYSVGLDLGATQPTTHIGNTTTFPLGYSTFIYGPSTNNVFALISGISFNKTFTIVPLYTLQIGASYHYIPSMTVKGNLEQGISPPYYQSSYFYDIKSSQYLAEVKLHREFFNYYFPYVHFGLGIASNRSYNYSTAVPSYLTVTPNYSNKTVYSFAYSLGIGVDYLVNLKSSIGLGYRFINLGKAGLGTGIIRNINVGEKLTQSNLYMNALLIQINYFI